MLQNSSSRSSSKRRDDYGRAFAGSQMQLQVWVNCRREKLNAAIKQALGMPTPCSIEWKSPVPPRFKELRDGAFLRAVGLSSHRTALGKFWPKGGPVWDGLAVSRMPSQTNESVVLVEAKSYPEEVLGSGCQATPGSDARTKIEDSLAKTAKWLGVKNREAWLGTMYQSANRIGHLYFLREVVGVDAYMVNVCFESDPHRPTSLATWHEAHRQFRETLGLQSAQLPWLADIVLPAADRSEILALAI